MVVQSSCVSVGRNWIHSSFGGVFVSGSPSTWTWSHRVGRWIGVKVIHAEPSATATRERAPPKWDSLGGSSIQSQATDADSTDIGEPSPERKMMVCPAFDRMNRDPLV